MNWLNGLQNFLLLINDNWTTIIILVGLGVATVNRIKQYISLTNEEKIEIAKKQVSEIILKLISDAEVDYTEWNKAGSIKRSQVIKEIFNEYPILSKIADQNDIITWIDSEIDKSLEELRAIIQKNKGSAENDNRS